MAECKDSKVEIDLDKGNKVEVDLDKGNKVEVECIQREFGHACVKWKIRNYGYAAHGMKYEIEAPSFTVRPHMTSWRMGLQTELGLCDDPEVRFYLERTDSSAPDIVWVNMDISLSDRNGSQWPGPRGEHEFKRNNRIVLDIPNIYYGRAEAGLYDFPPMTLQCQMIVHEKTNRWEGRIESISYGLRALSEDLEWLYEDMKYGNFTIRLDEGTRETKVHKAILSARSEAMKDVLARKYRPSYLPCENLHHDEVRQVLRYVYSGDVGDILDKPSISAFECLNNLYLNEAENHYVADQHFLHSDITIQEAKTCWTIKNFMEEDELFVSSIVTSEDMDWELKLYPRGKEGKDDFLTITAELDCGVTGDVWAKIEVYHDRYHRSWKTLHPVNESRLYELENFESRESILKKLEDGALKLCFKSNIAISVDHWSSVKLADYSLNVPYESSYKQLSDDILSLRNDTRYSDIIITGHTGEFHAHRCILAARSDVFEDLSEDLQEDMSYYAECTEGYIVEMVLDYIYSGIFKEPEKKHTLHRLYLAANRMGVRSLVKEAREAMLNRMTDSDIWLVRFFARKAEDYEFLSELPEIEFVSSLRDPEMTEKEEFKPPPAVRFNKPLDSNDYLKMWEDLK